MAASRIRPAVEADAAMLAINMRQEDREEIIASDGPDVHATVLESIRRSEEAWALTIGGELACVWGIVRSPFGLGSVADGVIWMLSTNVVDQNKKSFWRECKRVVPDLTDRWGMLVNAIDTRHTKAIRWGHRLGFRFTKVEEFGIAKKPFAFFSVGG